MEIHRDANLVGMSCYLLMLCPFPRLIKKKGLEWGETFLLSIDFSFSKTKLFWKEKEKVEEDENEKNGKKEKKEDENEKEKGKKEEKKIWY
jgi:hypothetical protein